MMRRLTQVEIASRRRILFVMRWWRPWTRVMRWGRWRS